MQTNSWSLEKNNAWTHCDKVRKGKYLVHVQKKKFDIPTAMSTLSIATQKSVNVFSGFLNDERVTPKAILALNNEIESLIQRGVGNFFSQ